MGAVKGLQPLINPGVFRQSQASAGRFFLFWILACTGSKAPGEKAVRRTARAKGRCKEAHPPCEGRCPGNHGKGPEPRGKGGTPPGVHRRDQRNPCPILPKSMAKTPLHAIAAGETAPDKAPRGGEGTGPYAPAVEAFPLRGRSGGFGGLPDKHARDSCGAYEPGNRVFRIEAPQKRDDTAMDRLRAGKCEAPLVLAQKAFSGAQGKAGYSSLRLAKAVVCGVCRQQEPLAPRGSPALRAKAGLQRKAKSLKPYR